MASSEPQYDFLDPPSQPGDLGTLSHYRVISELGRGGMGYVFRAQDNRLKREVAMKVMNQKVAGTPHSRRRFIHEARAMAAVHHDNVATIFEVGEQSGTPFMAMEMLQGSTLETFNRGDQRLGYEQIIRYAKQIARGLAAAHAKGIVHRDIKPANIWIETEKDRIKILDFGLALAATPVDRLSGRGAVIGTPGYLSPEQARTEPLDDRSDLYSLGVVLYELCTGRLPLNAGSVSGQLIAILAHRPRPLVELNPSIPVPLADLIHRLLYKEPRARVPSAVALEKELARVEVECHAKSEVAQTISKLQLGLEQVVSKKAAPLLVEPAEDVEVLDPFAAFPEDPLATAPVAAAPLATPAYVRPPVRQASKPETPAWQTYLPWGVVAVLLLIVLPIMAYAFTRGGGNEAAVTIAQATDTASSDRPANSNRPANNPATQNNNGNNNTAKNRNAANASETKNANPDRSSTNRPGNNRNNAQRTGANAVNQNAAGKRQGTGTNAGQNPNAANRNQAANRNTGQANRSEMAVSNNPKSNASDRSPAMTSVSMSPSDSRKNTGPGPNEVTRVQKPAVEPVPRASIAPEPAVSPPVLVSWSISTALGRGADTMVQIGTSAKLGLKPSIGIHKRGDIESHHSYVRFDLAEIEDVKETVASAELLLTAVSRNRPVGATVQIYGIASAGVPLWQEEGPRSLLWNNTPSKAGLGTLPLLGTVTVTAEGDPRDETKKTIRIANPELAAFIRDSAGDTLNLVIAGDSNAKAPLRFVSREGNPKLAPTLVIETAKAKPAK